jgi:hypothetical protein
MKTRFTPSLESLGERLNLSIWVPTTEQTRQITIVVDLAPPEPPADLSARGTDIPSVTDLVIDPFDGGAAGVVTGRITGVAVDPSDPSIEGDQTLVFFLGGIPSDETPNYFVYGTELPDADAAIRHRMFALVDRTQMAAGDVVLLASSLPGSDAELARRNLVTLLSTDLERPGTAPAPDGRKYKMLVAPLVLELDEPSAGGDPFAFARDGRASGM